MDYVLLFLLVFARNMLIPASAVEKNRKYVLRMLAFIVIANLEVPAAFFLEYFGTSWLIARFTIVFSGLFLFYNRIILRKVILVIACLISILLPFFYQIEKINGTSMEPFIKDRSVCLATSYHTGFSRHDTVISQCPGISGMYLIKRIHGLPGQTITLNKRLFINGKEQTSPVFTVPQSMIEKKKNILFFPLIASKHAILRFSKHSGEYTAHTSTGKIFKITVSTENLIINGQNIPFYNEIPGKIQLEFSSSGLLVSGNAKHINIPGISGKITPRFYLKVDGNQDSKYMTYLFKPCWESTFRPIRNLKLKGNEYFILSDNPASSLDSRRLGKFRIHRKGRKPFTTCLEPVMLERKGGRYIVYLTTEGMEEQPADLVTKVEILGFNAALPEKFISGKVLFIYPCGLLPWKWE